MGAFVVCGTSAIDIPAIQSVAFINTPVKPGNTYVSTGDLKVQLVTGGTDNNQQSAFHFLVKNTGSSAQSNISVRIYFTEDGSQAADTYVLEKYYDQSGAATVSGRTLASGSTYYFTVSYGTTTLPAGTDWEYHTALRLNIWSKYHHASLHTCAVRDLLGKSCRCRVAKQC